MCRPASLISLIVNVLKTILPLCVVVPCVAFSSNLLNHPNIIVRSLDAGFNPSQEIDVTGAHAFVAAGRGDFRGPYPGLNALANHNYIPLVSFLDAAMAAMEGMRYYLGPWYSCASSFRAWTRSSSNCLSLRRKFPRPNFTVFHWGAGGWRSSRVHI
jgi:hypothetical protein